MLVTKEVSTVLCRDVVVIIAIVVVVVVMLCVFLSGKQSLDSKAAVGAGSGLGNLFAGRILSGISEWAPSFLLAGSALKTGQLSVTPSGDGLPCALETQM